MREQTMQTMRQRYLAKEISHHEYYGALAKALGVEFDFDDPFIRMVKKALNDGDKHLNTIPLHVWDRKGDYLVRDPRHRETFKTFGDSPSMAGVVCVLKAAARDAV